MRQLLLPTDVARPWCPTSSELRPRSTQKAVRSLEGISCITRTRSAERTPDFRNWIALPRPSSRKSSRPASSRAYPCVLSWRRVLPDPTSRPAPRRSSRLPKRSLAVTPTAPSDPPASPRMKTRRAWRTARASSPIFVWGSPRSVAGSPRSKNVFCKRSHPETPFSAILEIEAARCPSWSWSWSWS
jgi:hypothetical protein